MTYRYCHVKTHATLNIEFENIPVTFNRDTPEHVSNKYKYKSYHGNPRDNVQKQAIYRQAPRYDSVVKAENASFDKP